MGTVLAKLNPSAWRVPLPRMNAISIARTRPRTRDTAVPDAITAVAFSSLRPPCSPDGVTSACAGDAAG